MKTKMQKIVSGVMALGMLFCVGTTTTGCQKATKDSIVLMAEEMEGLFNPFYATSGADMEVVGMTQLSMLSTDDNGSPVAGDDEATVVKAFDVAESEKQTVYTFVLKNGLKYSDGVPLTMNDVMFNLYEYLDPVYTGSTTLYSVDIVGLSQYRLQQNGNNDNATKELETKAAVLAQNRINELVNLYEKIGKTTSTGTSYEAEEDEMRAAILSSSYTPSKGYKESVSEETLTDDEYRQQLLEDYEFTLKTFKEELQSDYKAAKESYDLNEKPYSEWASKLSNDVFKFFLYEGYITPKYEEIEGKKDLTKILSFDGETYVTNYSTEEAAIQRVYGDKVTYELNAVLTQWGTAGTLKTQYTAKATDILLQQNKKDDGSLNFPNISGIVSLGHTTTTSSVSVGGTTYRVAHEHNSDGTPVAADEYDVLQITINGVDPKAIYNFGFGVAPVHYYTADADHPNGRTVDIANNQFGVEWANSDFQTKVIQSQDHVSVPLGAGPYRATNAANEDSTTGAEFWKNNVVYYKANENFMFPVKTEKIRYQVVSPSNALDKLANNEVDFVTPQYRSENYERLESMKKDGYESVSTWQLGYGYIGINAGKVPNVNIRRAIMAAMETSLAVDYYVEGTCMTIDWPMSMQSWAYPFQDDGYTSKLNNHDYATWTGLDGARKKIQKYMNAAGVQAHDSSLNITFTIAGSSISEHPTYGVFKQAAELLNQEFGWGIEVKADSMALTKLSTGSLEVWAAAWGSTIDPDMYQVYHKNSKATSVYAWGYREIKSNSTLYSYENGILDQLSKVIDKARSTTDRATRTADYETAMGYVLDLAIELPVYQRQTLYAYNAKTISGVNTDLKSSYTSPLEKVWELELIG